MINRKEVTVARRPHIVLVAGYRGVTAAAVIVTGLAGCSGNAPSGPHRTTLPHAIGGYFLGIRQTGSKGTVFYMDKRFNGVKGGKYYRDGSGLGNSSLDPDSILVETGHVIKIAARQALVDIYERFKSIGKVGDQSPFGMMQTVPAGSLGGQASCWRVGATVNGSTAQDGAMCMWVDSDTFGLLLTPAMPPGKLAATMLTFRSAIEKPASVASRKT
jgi:hypothetical protein